MTTLLGYPTGDGGTVFIETDDAPVATVRAGFGDATVRRGLHPTDVAVEASEDFATLVQRISDPIHAILSVFQDARDEIDEVELGFALTVRADAGIVVSKI